MDSTSDSTPPRRRGRPPKNRGASSSRSRSRSRPRSTSKTPRKTAEGSVTRRSTSKSPSRKKSPESNGTATPIRASLRIQQKIENDMGRKRTTASGDRTDASPAVKKGGKAQAEGHADVIGFGGAWGGAACSVALPLVVMYINIACSKGNTCSPFALPSCPGSWQPFFNLHAFGVVLSWYVFQAALAMLPIGPVFQGQPLKDGRRLDYRCNGFLSLIITVIAFAVAVKLNAPVEWIVAHWLHVVTAGVVYSFLLAIWMYVRSLSQPANQLAAECTGNFFNDFWMGRELNPRTEHLDFKFFFELRPGLIGWMLIDWCFIVAQFKQEGAVLPALALVTVFHTIYVFDALRNEPAILTTMDITTEGFGLMLAFGDLAWVPYLYSLQAIFLYNFPGQAVTSPYALVAICLLQLTGLAIFRGANSQKNEFRLNPKAPQFAQSRVVPTASGKGLLCSGYWGICRRPNYLGDLLMSLAWSLPCGFNYLMPYFYPIHFALLLTHRCLRDEAYCKMKYGDAWDKYCQAVPYRIIPYIF